VALTAVALCASAAQAGKIVATPTPPSFYVLKNAKARCKAHYTKTVVLVKARRNGKRVKVKQVRCVYGTLNHAGAGGNGKSTLPNFPTNLPTGTVTVTVLPTAASHTYTTAAGQALDEGAPGVLANATGTNLSAVLVSGPQHGSLTLDRDGSFSYAPAGGASGVEHFVYKAESSNGEGSWPTSVTIKVVPVAQDAVYAIASGSTLTIPAGGLLSGDLGSGLTATLVNGPADGALTLNPDGSATYTPSADFTGADQFSYQAVDGAAQHSNTATVTVNVGAQPPAIVPETFSGAVGNTEYQVGGSGGGGPEVYVSSSALAGDTDPNGGILSVTPGTITTAHGGTVTMAANGDFIYQPPVGFDGASDSFSYTVDESEGLSVGASATIDFVSGARVWYVNDAASAGGNGTSAAPFDSLSSVAATSGDVIFVAGGGSPYPGGIVLPAGVSLIGSGAPLVAGGVTLLNPAGAPPVVTGGPAITLANGDRIAGLTVQGTSGDAILASNVNSFTIDSTVSVTSAQGDGLDINGGGGTINVGAQIGGAAAHSVAIQNLAAGSDVTIGGAINDSGTGVLVQNDNATAEVDFTGAITASTGVHTAFAATGGGAVSATSDASTLATTTAEALDVSAGSTIGSAGLRFLSISAGTPSSGAPDHGILINAPAGGGGLQVLGASTAGSGGTIQKTTSDAISITGAGPVQLTQMNITSPHGDGVYALNVPELSATFLAISNAGAYGIATTGDGSDAQTFDIERNTISGQPDAAISLASSTGTAGSGPSQGFISHNIIGTNVAGSGSSSGDGIDVTVGSAGNGGTLYAEADDNVIGNVPLGAGIDGQSLGGATLDLTLTNDLVTMAGSGSKNAVTVDESSAGGTVCVNPTLNELQSSGTGAFDIALDQQSASGSFAIDSYDGSGIANFLTNTDLNVFHGGGVSATTAGSAFVGAHCTAPATNSG